MEHFYQTVEGWSQGIDKLYLHVMKTADDGMHFVEVGSWKGRSASFMAVEIINSEKQIQFDCVDTWKGSEENQKDKDVIENTLFEVFTENMKPVNGHYKAIRLPSINAAELYDDESLDFVFIDAAHDYENVKKDILAWYPKVKKGGLLCGHDYPSLQVQEAVHEVLDNVEQFNKNCWLVKK